METLKYAVLGVVQGLTEFLPVSSSGHLAIAHRLIGTGADLGFDTAVHLGTGLAVVIFYFRQIGAYAADLLSPLLKGGREGGGAGGTRLLMLLAVTSLPAALAGYFLEAKVEAAFSSPIAISVFLCATGLVLIGISRVRQGRIGSPTEMGFGAAFAIGLFQAAALFPGVSRSGMTIAAGLICGLSAAWAVDYSMMASLPVILGAFILQAAGGGMSSFGQGWANMAVGIIASFLTGLVAITVLRRLAAKRSFFPFAVWVFAAAAFNLVLYLSYGV